MNTFTSQQAAFTHLSNKVKRALQICQDRATEGVMRPLTAVVRGFAVFDRLSGRGHAPAGGGGRGCLEPILAGVL